uniref:GLOBIN domain-containing protein n=1 Tax=Parastrongyloides trichosuri TaxID=131310 RepID=A0A0N5A2T6_PARTI
MMNNSEVKNITRKSLEVLRLDDENAAVPHGVDFYKYMFKNVPQLRVFFKGAENYSPEQVGTSERFAKQGVRLMLAMHILASNYDDQPTFLAYTRETVNRHRIYKMPEELWTAFFPLWMDFLQTKGSLTSEAKAAWTQLGKTFTDEVHRHLHKS